MLRDLASNEEAHSLIIELFPLLGQVLPLSQVLKWIRLFGTPCRVDKGPVVARVSTASVDADANKTVHELIIVLFKDLKDLFVLWLCSLLLG